MAAASAAGVSARSYTFLDDPTILQKGRAGLLSLIQGGDELTAGDLERVTAATEADVVAVMVVHTMESYYVERPSFPLRWP